MLFAHAVFNIFTGVLDVTNCILRVLNDVRQNVAAVLLFLYSIIRYGLDAIMFRIMFVLIRVFRELDRYGLARVKINYADSFRGMKIYAALAKLQDGWSC